MYTTVGKGQVIFKKGGVLKFFEEKRGIVKF